MKNLLKLLLFTFVFTSCQNLTQNPVKDEPINYGTPLTKVQENWYSEHDAVILNFALDSAVVIIDSVIDYEAIYLKFKTSKVLMSMFIRTDVKNYDINNISYTFYDLNDMIMFDSDEYKNSPKLNKVTKNCHKQFLKFLNEFYVKPYKKEQL